MYPNNTNNLFGPDDCIMKNTDRPKVRRYILRFCLALQDQKIISTIYFFGLQRADSCSIYRRTAHPALNVIVIPPEVKFNHDGLGSFLVGSTPVQ